MTDRSQTERAVIEAAREWAKGARTMPETIEEIARDGALYDALEVLAALPPETPAEKAQWVREALADEEVRRLVAEQEFDEWAERAGIKKSPEARLLIIERFDNDLRRYFAKEAQNDG